MVYNERLMCMHVYNFMEFFLHEIEIDFWIHRTRRPVPSKRGMCSYLTAINNKRLIKRMDPECGRNSSL